MSLDYASILQNQATSIILLDANLAVTYLNESAERLLNTSLRRARANILTELVRDSGQLVAACEKVVAGAGEIRMRDHEMLLPASVSELHVDCVVSTLPDAYEGAKLLLEILEIEMPNRIARDEEFLQRQQSNQAMIRGMAHEIRNPLGGIRGAAQLLAEEAGSEDFAEYTRIIIQEADRLTELVNRMHAQTRVDLDQMVNIHQVLEHVRHLMLAEADNSKGPMLSIVQDYDPSLPDVRGNRDLLIQASLNVIRNAVEALQEMPEDGQITLRTRIDHLALDGRRQQVVRVDISDNGPGIDRSIVTRIFDPMVTGKANGTGLGLPITAEIITQHGGALDFQSHPGETVFRLYLPITGSVKES